ncbi:MAG: GH116 family glycosyl hydrolase [bacterium]
MSKRRLPYSAKELIKRGPQPTYRRQGLDHIAFPLGGIGTGTVSLGGWGQLRDWEIRNRPAKGFAAPHAFFTLKVSEGNKPPLTRVVQGPAGGDYIGDGHSMPHLSGEGLPCFAKATFRGGYPFATVRFRDPDVPVRVTLEAFNPFIPLNDKDSGIPAAIFLYRLRNTARCKVDVTLFGNAANIVGEPQGRVNEGRQDPGIAGVYFTTEAHPPACPRFGSMALATPWEDAAVWPSWPAGPAALGKFWEAVAGSDAFPPPYEEGGDQGTVVARATVRANSEVTIPFVLAWHFPVFEHWQTTRDKEGRERRATWRNYYATLWSDAWDVAEYVITNYDRLEQETRAFRDALFASTLPTHVLDAVSSQLSVLRTPTCIRLEDGTFYGFEGSNPTSGCCEGSCTHVWNYAQALPYLFPALQRSMLEAHFAHSMSEDGYVQFRMPLPLGTRAKAGFVPAADGQMGLILQVYREWLIANDQAWLRRVWPQARRALEFAWKYWDADQDGVMEGVQHNTYDMEWWGPNTMCGSLYLGALRAGEELARIVGDDESAKTYRKLFERGSAWTDKYLYNGDYYEQQVNPKAVEPWPHPYREVYDRGRDDRFPTWPRWQFGQGCLSDQLIGQWYATMLGLGYLYERRNVRKTLRSIFRHNWKPRLRLHPSSLRIYAAGDEAGLLVATWPQGGRPGYPFWFCDEVWCGIEYQVASHLLAEGMAERALAIVKGLRERHRGERRNPWDEFECGHHYARSMASYALLLAASGFRYNAAEGSIGFFPRLFEHNFRTFFCTAAGWGLYTQKVGESQAELSLRVDYGGLPLRRVLTPLISRKATDVVATLAGQERRTAIEKADRGYAIVFERPLTIDRGQTLRITIS